MDLFDLMVIVAVSSLGIWLGKKFGPLAVFQTQIISESKYHLRSCKHFKMEVNRVSLIDVWIRAIIIGLYGFAATLTCLCIIEALHDLEMQMCLMREKCEENY